MSEDHETPILIWEQPPDGTSARGKWETVLDELRAFPGCWARISDDASPSLASTIKAGKIKGCEPGEFDALSRSSGRIDGRAAIWCRYVGGDSQ